MDISELLERMQNMVNQMALVAEMVEKMDFALKYLPISDNKRA